jgi:Na+-transporting NADH:ubiquinone oxidoreductase subunit NqrD
MLVVYEPMATEVVGVCSGMAVAITTDSVMCTCLARVTCMIKPFGAMAGRRGVASVQAMQNQTLH